MVDVAEKERRMTICRGCPQHWSKLATVFCKKCGCAIAFKAQLEGARGGKCPEGKW